MSLHHRHPVSLLFTAFFIFVLYAGAYAQEAPEKSSVEKAVEGLEYREVGPAVMGGRVADLAVVESNPATFYVGTATGGVWKTTSQGMHWEPIFDDQSTSSVGDVTLAPSNPNIIWVGTGEPQNRQSSPWGDGDEALPLRNRWPTGGPFASPHSSR